MVIRNFSSCLSPDKDPTADRSDLTLSKPIGSESVGFGTEESPAFRPLNTYMCTEENLKLSKNRFQIQRFPVNIACYVR